MTVKSRRFSWLGLSLIAAASLIALFAARGYAAPTGSDPVRPPAAVVAAAHRSTIPGPALPAGLQAPARSRVDAGLAGPVGLVPVSGAVVPVPKQDPCLSCHVVGEFKNPTTPPLRWALFGAAGLVFALGMVRSATVWRTRTPWQPLAARAAGWVDERYEVSKPLSEALSKPVPRFARQWMYCLGGMTAFVFVVQAVTGIMLAFYYQPTTEAAYASIEYIENTVRFGAETRTIHAWSANAMIILCVAHMLRTFIVGAYKRPRELNWVTGVVLLVVTLAFGFTGYLLPWDQRAFWATTVGSDIAGGIPVIGNLALILLRVGWSVTGATLSRFYALHVIILPIATLAFMGAHFLMVRRLGIYRPL